MTWTKRKESICEGIVVQNNRQCGKILVYVLSTYCLSLCLEGFFSRISVRALFKRNKTIMITLYPDDSFCSYSRFSKLAEENFTRCWSNHFIRSIMFVQTVCLFVFLGLSITFCTNFIHKSQLNSRTFTCDISCKKTHISNLLSCLFHNYERWGEATLEHKNLWNPRNLKPKNYFLTHFKVDDFFLYKT